MRSLGTSIKACAVSPDGHVRVCPRDPQVHSRVYSSIYGHGLDPKPTTVQYWCARRRYSTKRLCLGDTGSTACCLVQYTRENRTLLPGASSIVVVRRHGLAYVDCCAPSRRGKRRAEGASAVNQIATWPQSEASTRLFPGAEDGGQLSQVRLGEAGRMSMEIARSRYRPYSGVVAM